ncbi:hypothetical protein F4781DRAFT_444712 [Neofusicoccum parvum]|uniref:Uncharacterized protein n=1 Tax=Neofusicoccum parvum TaxID=310453 RepID=A0ACB5RTW6_9PEZI|nr:hypothetical protein F4781DRAFT_444712 [Neofusicoccum parvum]
MDKAIDKAVNVFKTEGIPVFKPGEEDYERSVATPNLLFRFSRPNCVVQPENESHVQTIIKQAKSERLKVTIKCGGHSYAGHSTAFRGISLDLRRMNNATFDIDEETVTVDGGCQWGNVYKTLVNGKHNGLVVNGGRCPPVGVGGFILGGGLSPFTRSFGMGSDTLMEATIVTADGKSVIVSDSDDPDSDEGKLFWALRGAGGGNFSVLVNMKLKAQKLRSNDVVAGRYQWFPKPRLTDEVMATMNKFYTTNWPNNMTIDSTWLCDLRQKTGDGVRFTLYFDGNKKEFDKIIDKYIDQPDLATQLKRRSLPEKSTRFLHETLVAQWSEEIKKAFPTNKSYSIYSSFVFNNNKKKNISEITAIIREAMEKFRNDFDGEKVEFLVTWIHSGGKAKEKKPGETAFFWRQATFHTYITVEWEDKWMEGDMRRFMGTVKKKLRPFSLDKRAAFINFPDGKLRTKAHERAYFGENREKLRRVKQIWDKDNFFKWEQGVQLPQAPEEDILDVDASDEEMFTDIIASDQWEYYTANDLKEDLRELANLGF